MENVNIQEARELLYNSAIVKYVDIREIEEQLENIHIYNTEEEFIKAYGGRYLGGILEGFNRNNYNHLNPKYLTPHKIIHEVLHGLSSEFDKEGHRIKNGIQGNNQYDFSVQVNEGLTDYLAAKISGEPQTHYIQGEMLFGAIEEALIKEFDDSDILFDVYLNNRVDVLQSFLDRYGGKGTFENIYNNFLFLDRRSMDIITNKINKNFQKHMRKKQVIHKIKNMFRINKIKRLPEGVFEQENTKTDGHARFVNEYKDERYEYPDLSKYNDNEVQPIKIEEVKEQDEKA